ncbi:MAG: hypothetical protein IID18_07485, partial [Nitrospinae bacterium]|nr:hypothetical protein [Nitrospinota bacterium]
MRILATSVLLMLCAAPLASGATGETVNRRTPIVRAVEKVGPAVVNINTEEAAPAIRNPFRNFRNP